MGPRKHVSHGVQIPMGRAILDFDSGGPRKHVLGGSANWRHLTNTIEPSVCGGDAACCQITLTTCQ